VKTRSLLHAHRLGAAVLVAGVMVVHADTATTQAPLASPSSAVSASVNLKFAVTLGSFVYLRVGSVGATVDTVAFDLASLTAGCTMGPCTFGTGMAVAASSFGTLPVGVKSKGGVVRLSATATTGLSSGAATIPLSEITIASSDTTNLPAPLVPNSGTSGTVNVTETATGSKLTARSANWTFAYANTVVPSAGTYTGKLTFTATAP